ncbi:MAG: hypothetical protein MUF54_05475 [Polyangiaceae bacterium]|jgi:hypothetical protein|nr:hypothetical protein [Polyangiaceae bacterium]
MPDRPDPSESLDRLLDLQTPLALSPGTIARESWDCLDSLSDWLADDLPTVERSVPLELIQSIHSQSWADSCPTVVMPMPAELVARSVPPSHDADTARPPPAPCAPGAPSQSVSWTLPDVSRPALALSIAFAVSVTLASVSAMLIRYGFGQP